MMFKISSHGLQAVANMAKGNQKVERIKLLLVSCSEEQRREVLASLRRQFPIHPLESKLGLQAEMILEAIDRSSDLTLRGVKGIIAELCFKTEVLDRLSGWRTQQIEGNPSYDFRIRDGNGEVRVQVKMQRSENKQPSQYSCGMYKVEVQKTRGGINRQTEEETRPYRFGDFDILAVSTWATTKNWGSFRYTVADWLIPSPKDDRIIRTFQPISVQCNADWTDSLETCINWFRSQQKKQITDAVRKSAFRGNC